MADEGEEMRRTRELTRTKEGVAAMRREERARRRRALDGAWMAEDGGDGGGFCRSFEGFVEKRGGAELRRTKAPTILQVNVGLYCNQACTHCHVESSPLRVSETMREETREKVEQVLKQSPTVKVLDITGGAPELATEFRKLIENARKLRPEIEIIDRCNLTVFYEPGQEDLGEFLKLHDVRVVASLPCYSKENTDMQRGKGVFERSIDALKLLNDLGYGKGERRLDLVYNPNGAFLPPAQDKLEVAYKSELREAYGIEFSNLLTITNMPIKRYADYLHRENKTEVYMKLLVDNFNVRAADNVMCREVLSIKWDGSLYDCDFNQQLDIGVPSAKRTVFDITSVNDVAGLKIASDNHCFGCTAGAGSSCGGTLE